MVRQNRQKNATYTGAERGFLRLKAAELLKQGKKQSLIARRLGVSRQSVSRWNKLLATHGIQRLQYEGGRPSLVDPAALRQFIRSLKCQYADSGPTAPSHWSTAWVRERIAERFGIAYDPAHVWRLLRRFGHQWPPRGRRPDLPTESQRDESTRGVSIETPLPHEKRKGTQRTMRSQADSGLLPALARLSDEHGLDDRTRARFAAGTRAQQQQVVDAALQVQKDKKLQFLVLRGAEAVWLDAELRQLRGTVQTLNDELSRRRHAVAFELETLRRANMHLTREANALDAELRRIRGDRHPKGRRYPRSAHQRARKRQDFITKLIT